MVSGCLLPLTRLGAMALLRSQQLSGFQLLKMWLTTFY